MISLRLRRSLVAVAATSLLLAGCGGYDETPLPNSAAAAEDDGAAPPVKTDKTCDPANPTVSYAPEGSVSSLKGSRGVVDIADDDKLTVGVSADQLQMGFRNPQSGQIEGFDIDMASRIAKEMGVRLEIKVISPAQRFDFLEDGTVEMVARNMTINCDRWARIAFSEEYYRSGQKVLVAKDSPLAKASEAATAQGRQLSKQQVIAGLDGQRVCAPTGTTSLDNIKKSFTGATAVEVGNDSECLVAFQNAKADALSTDDTVLAGMAIQDPYALVLNQEFLTAEPYGIGVNKDNTDMVRFVNAVLEEMRGDGSWLASYNLWLKSALGGAKGVQPAARYGRQP